MPTCSMNLFPSVQSNRYNYLVNNNFNRNNFNRNNFNVGLDPRRNNFLQYPNTLPYYVENIFHLKGRDMFRIKEHKSCGCGG
jgi:hypothetical protein